MIHPCGLAADLRDVSSRIEVESVMNSIARLVCLLKQEERAGLVKSLCSSLTSEAHPGCEAARMRM